LLLNPAASISSPFAALLIRVALPKTIDVENHLWEKQQNMGLKGASQHTDPLLT